MGRGGWCVVACVQERGGCWVCVERSSRVDDYFLQPAAFALRVAVSDSGLVRVCAPTRAAAAIHFTPAPTLTAPPPAIGHPHAPTPKRSRQPATSGHASRRPKVLVVGGGR
jgi:hypothetical protein